MMLWIADAIINAVNSKLTSKCVNLSNLTESHHLSDYLVYKWYDDEYEIFLADEHVGFIIETAPLVGNSESMQNELSNIFTQVLPEGASIQTMLFADKNIGDILNRYSLLRKSSSDSLFFLAKKRTDYLKQITLQHDLFPYVLRDFRCYMSIVLDITGCVDDAISQIVEIKKQIIATLSVVGVSYLSMNADDLVNLLRSIFNMRLDNVAEQYKQWNAFDLIQNQIIDNDTNFKVEDDLITLENHGTEIKTFCIEGYPPEWSLYQMSELIGDIYRDSRQMPFPFIFHYGVYIPKQANYLSKIALKANIVEKQLYSPIGKYIPDIEREYAELQYTQKCVSKGERLVRSYFGIIANPL